jgi:hypothetical protein
MDGIEIRLQRVLDLEANRGHTDWDKIKRECDEIIRLINEQNLTRYRGTVAYRFAEDYDVRRKSDEYAFMQHKQLTDWLKLV